MTKTGRVLVVLVVAVLAVYALAYAKCRRRGEIVHYKSWSSHNHHSVVAVDPDGRLLFIGALLASANSSNSVDYSVFEATMQEAGRRAERRRTALAIVFAPLRYAETLAW